MLELQTLDPRTISSWQIPCRGDEDSHNDDDGDDDGDDGDDGDDDDVMNRSGSLESPENGFSPTSVACDEDDNLDVQYIVNRQQKKRGFYLAS